MTGRKFVITGHEFDPAGNANWYALYLDDGGSVAQQKALKGLVKSLGFKTIATRIVPINYHVSDDGMRREVEIPGILKMASTRRVDDQGKAKGIKAIDMFGREIYYAKDVVHVYHDKEVGREFDWSGRQSNHKNFAATHADIEAGKMGWHLWDGSGKMPY